MERHPCRNPYLARCMQVPRCLHNHVRHCVRGGMWDMPSRTPKHLLHTYKIQSRSLPNVNRASMDQWQELRTNVLLQISEVHLVNLSSHILANIYIFVKLPPKLAPFLADLVCLSLFTVRYPLEKAHLHNVLQSSAPLIGSASLWSCP